MKIDKSVIFYYTLKAKHLENNNDKNLNSIEKQEIKTNCLRKEGKDTKKSDR